MSEKAKVYFTRDITPEKVLALYARLGIDLPGRVAVKLHSGEQGNQNFIRPPFWKPMIDQVQGTIVECNTAYGGSRGDSAAHWETMRKHGWTEIGQVDIMDEDGEFGIEVTGGRHLTVNYVGDHLRRYDSMLVLSHFKGHPMGGFGGAVKNISIGVASSHGKAVIHGAGDPKKIWTADHDSFLESMAEAAQSITRYFAGKMAYINVMANMSVDCDCCAKAEDPAIADIGMLASLDPIAVDQACLDLVYACDDPGKAHLLERIESRNGVHTLEAAAALDFGTREYELIEL